MIKKTSWKMSKYTKLSDNEGSKVILKGSIKLW